MERCRRARQATTLLKATGNAPATKIVAIGIHAVKCLFISRVLPIDDATSDVRTIPSTSMNAHTKRNLEPFLTAEAVKPTTNSAVRLQKPYTIQYKTALIVWTSSKAAIAQAEPPASVFDIGRPHVDMWGGAA